MIWAKVKIFISIRDRKHSMTAVACIGLLFTWKWQRWTGWRSWMSERMWSARRLYGWVKLGNITIAAYDLNIYQHNATVTNSLSLDKWSKTFSKIRKCFWGDKKKWKWHLEFLMIFTKDFSRYFTVLKNVQPQYNILTIIWQYEPIQVVESWLFTIDLVRCAFYCESCSYAG